MALGPGDKFGRYTIVELVGLGGMGQILRAIDNVLERQVALKIIRPDRVASEEALARFFREARLAAKLTHANTLQIYDLGAVDGVPFIAMEHIEGKALTAYCGRVDITIDRKMGWMLDAARGLAAAHRFNLVHRDVKPANIMVTDDNVVKVVDFGLAKRTSTSSKRFTAALRGRKSFHTELGFVLGTPVYMAPEQIEGAEIDARADQFAWGLTAYTLLVGRNPRIMEPDLVTPRPVGPKLAGVRSSIVTVLDRTLAVTPDERFATMEELVTALERALLDTSPASSRVPIKEKSTITQEPPLPTHATQGTQAGRRVWSFARTEHACPEAPFHVAAFARDGERIAAFGAIGMATFQGSWKSQPLPPALNGIDVRCCAFANDGMSVIVGGNRGLAARVMPSGHSERWHPEKREAMVLDGVEVAPHGGITFVGRSATSGVIARVGSSGGLDLTWTPLPLVSIVTLASGTQVACGPRGAIVSIDGTRVAELPRVTDVNLIAIARLGTGAVAVGADGVAVRIDETFHTSLENVRTTSSLGAVWGGEIDAWAASDVGRVMKRDRTGVWKRMAPDWGCEPSLLAIWAAGANVRAVARDASRIAGFRRA